jgi:hypothetical protein
MSVLALIVVIVLSALIIKVGSISLRMTGIDRETARFQSLSAFTGTGFTTTEAENIVNHPQRRRIIKALMVLGNVGVVTVVAMLFLSFRGGSLHDSLAKIGYLGLALITLVVFSLFRGLENVLDGFLEKRLKHITQFSMGGFSEIMRLASGYGIAEVGIAAGHPLHGKKLFESDLSRKDILILAIKRGIHLIPTPKANEAIEPGDKLVCFGLIRNLVEVAENAGEPAGGAGS